MEKIPTAEEFIHNFIMKNHKPHSLNDRGNAGSNTEMLMKEFAKLHVEAALKEASEKATVTPIDHEEISEGSFRPIWGVDDDSILNSYPLEKIQ